MSDAEATPSDELLEIDLTLEAAEVEMTVSTQELTELNVLGWVVMSKKPPGETIAVNLEVMPQGQYNIAAGAYPNALYFFYTGKQYFNLTIRLREDTPPGKEYLLDVDATAESKIAYDGDTFHLKIVTIPDLWGDAQMLEHPADAEPGGTTRGTVQVVNTGTRYCSYRMSVFQDPNAVVESVRFNARVEMKPNWVEQVPFDLTIAESTLPGEYNIVMALLVVHDDGSTAIVDQFNVHVTVDEAEEVTTFPYVAVSVVAVMVAGLAIAIMLRRKA